VFGGAPFFKFCSLFPGISNAVQGLVLMICGGVSGVVAGAQEFKDESGNEMNQSFQGFRV
jgi:hypothetical protein